jgi:hypothetical protein
VASLGGRGPTMWFYIFLLVLAVLFVVGVSRSNLFRHWRAHKSDPGQQGTGRGAAGHG